MCLKVFARSSKKRSMVVIYRYGCISKGMYVLIRGGRAGASERKVIQKNGTLRGGSNFILKGIKGETSLFFTVVWVNVFSYHIDVIFSYSKASYQSFLLNGNLQLLKFLLNSSSFITIHSSE